MNLYKVNSCNQDDLISHLSKCEFVPPLHTYVDIEKYAGKIVENARIFEAWNDKDGLIAVVAIYANEHSGETAFITNVSCITQYQKQGIVSELLSDGIKNVFAAGFMAIRLEVFSDNMKAINLYRKHSFKTIKSEGNKCILELRNNIVRVVKHKQLDGIITK